jgi:hypothetical protein
MACSFIFAVFSLWTFARVPDLSFPVILNEYKNDGRLDGKRAVPFIHVTDCFHPHGDPDDHFDLATVFALDHLGYLDLQAVCFDYTREAVLDGRDRRGLGDPAVMSLAQMQEITGHSVLFAVGSSRMLESKTDIQPGASAGDLAGANLILRIMRESDTAVAIGINGSSRDVALAMNLDQALFRKKCRGIYVLGALSSAEDPAKETNVSLDPIAFARIFDAPCPVYWLPGFGKPREKDKGFESDDYDSFFSTPHSRVFESVSPPVLNYFSYMFRVGHFDQGRQDPDVMWLRYLYGPADTVFFNRFTQPARGMWTTPGYLHAAGLTVDENGSIVPADRAVTPVFTFDRARIIVTDEGAPVWSLDDQGSNRYILHKHDKELYRRAMPMAVISLLKKLP